MAQTQENAPNKPVHLMYLCGAVVCFYITQWTLDWLWGYFARPPSEITVLEVVELLEGPLGRDASGIFADAATAARDVLAGSTIADVVEREARAAGVSMYHI